jgi:cell division protein FtsL
MGRLAALRESSRRFQRQWVMVFLFGMAALATVAGMYLNVSANAAIAGREIQNLEADISVIERTNADLQTNIATLLSNQTLEERAQAMNFQPVPRASLEYMVAPGYFPAQGVTMVAVVAPVESLLNRPEFNETLIDWAREQMKIAALPLSVINR